MTIKTMSGTEFKLRFKEFINTLQDDDQVVFGGGDLSLYRIKERGPVQGPRLVQIEFNEVYSVTVCPDKT